MADPHPRINPWTLAFSERDLERDFTRTFHSRLKSFDWRVQVVLLFISLCCAARLPAPRASEGQLLLEYALLRVVTVIVPALLLPTADYVTLRPWCTAALRVSRVAHHLLAVWPMLRQGPSCELMRLTMVESVISLASSTLLTWSLFRHHVPWSAAAAAANLFVSLNRDGGLCAAFAAALGAAGAVEGAGVAGLDGPLLSHHHADNVSSVAGAAAAAAGGGHLLGDGDGDVVARLLPPTDMPVCHSVYTRMIDLQWAISAVTGVWGMQPQLQTPGTIAAAADNAPAVVAGVGSAAATASEAAAAAVAGGGGGGGGAATAALALARCRSLVAFSVIVLGFMLPTMALYALELSTRQRYLRERGLVTREPERWVAPPSWGVKAMVLLGLIPSVWLFCSQL